MQGVASESSTFPRIVIKLSGEALAGQTGFGIDPAALSGLAMEIKTAVAEGIQIAVVLGGGNFLRGVTATADGIDRVTADHMGMLATVINALAFKQALQSQGMIARIQSAIPMIPLVEPYLRDRTVKYLDSGAIVIFAAGTGNPCFTTDTAASLRAIEIEASLLLKATKVDGVYNRDPVTDPTATRYKTLSYDDILRDKLGVMDATAIALCRDYKLPLRVFNINEDGSLLRVVRGLDEGTLVTTEANQ